MCADVALDVDAGATSVSTSPPALSSNTQRSVTYSAFCPRAAATGPLGFAVLDGAHELALAAFLLDVQLPVPDREPEAAGREGADEHHALGVLADVDEAAGPGQARSELADVQVALGIGLREAREGDVEPAAVVEVELRGLVDDRLVLTAARSSGPRPAGRRSRRARWSASAVRAPVPRWRRRRCPRACRCRG